ncbi:MAG TPA: triose-phosphate isomerase [Holophagaceae bacterium]|jgi:triosephosphate isomerase|nr:triose-phosphate isomerase [Holophagaceae bacterium]
MRCLVANWKMNMLSSGAAAFCETLLADPKVEGSSDLHLGIAPPFTLLRPMTDALRGSRISIFGQNAHAEGGGAFTGEISMAMLKDAGCSGVILGHSERRRLFSETDEALAAKLQAAWDAELLPLLCIGESLEERESEQTFAVLQRQLSILDGKSGALWIAYEPLWAIGTGRRAEARQIQEAHSYIRGELMTRMDEAAWRVPILYGGSVTPENFPELLQVPEVAGGLVGGASLDAAKFMTMVKAAQA